MSTGHPYFEELIRKKPLKGKVAIITGASRGIGREIALTFARAGCNIVIAAKSAEVQPTLPGTIYSVAKEVEALGVEALPIQVDVRNDSSVDEMVKQTVNKWGRVDILINNAGALWWKNFQDTPMKRYDLINSINSRGAFTCTRAVMPYMLKQGWGHVVNMSPPIDLTMLPGKIGYSISKFGMTLLAHGLGQELKGKGIGVNALWPATLVESYATINFKMGDKSAWRKASIIADATLAICCSDPNELTGYAIIDEDLLKGLGIQDFKPYRCDPNVEPPRLPSNIKPEIGKVSDVRNIMNSMTPAKL